MTLTIAFLCFTMALIAMDHDRTRRDIRVLKESNELLAKNHRTFCNILDAHDKIQDMHRVEINALVALCCAQKEHET